MRRAAFPFVIASRALHGCAVPQAKEAAKLAEKAAKEAEEKKKVFGAVRPASSELQWLPVGL
jgi:hypothetical protein